MNAPKIGDFVKVRLPGETPWAECVAVAEDGTWQGRIQNYLFAQGEPVPLHDYKQDQIVWFGRRENVWQPIEFKGNA